MVGWRGEEAMDGVAERHKNSICEHDGEWQFPAGTVFVKTFQLHVDDTDPAALRAFQGSPNWSWRWNRYVSRSKSSRPASGGSHRRSVMPPVATRLPILATAVSRRGALLPPVRLSVVPFPPATCPRGDTRLGPRWQPVESSRRALRDSVHGSIAPAIQAVGVAPVAPTRRPQARRTAVDRRRR